MTSQRPDTARGFGPPVVELVAADYAYEDGPPVLSAVSFAIHEGRATALLGRNGGGKTTLLRLLSGGLRCAPGQLVLEGSPVRYDRKGLTRLRTTVQLVVQDPDDQLFAASVEQDVSFGPMNLGLPEEEVRARVRDALEALDIAGLRDRPTHLLSYGQRKRAAIAGAVAMRPRVLVLDEPTAGLDPHGQERLLDVLARLRTTGTTIVMATHDVDLALRWADDAAVLTDEGLRTGSVATLLARQELLDAARLRKPWSMAVTEVLTAGGLLPKGAAAPRTPEELARWAAPGHFGPSLAGSGQDPGSGPGPSPNGLPGPAGQRLSDLS
ncbi:energy-coupling factor ABC transporter ATP-binding protein [Streptomyces zagrosensis]|uniref:ABC transporter ATP-binding protein n=1 Tax=Streptomyces zagrosensis TaxID=1042984 RepID=A0A7W9V2V5_9ACTN|nr:ATP-binding cassette domain-containing protein [Streptomyces zagrosensis]MBB5939676.1 cobalt/nickel transport system ATP-binding protein [Streptomyces zagrosensis]